jgi:hypothetical protein
MSLHGDIVCERLKGRPLPAGVATPRAVITSEDGVLLCYGTTEPTGAGYAPGCIFIDTNASSSAFLYINEGSATTADFKYVATGT